MKLYKIMHKLVSVDRSTWFNMVGEILANTRLNNHPLNIIPRKVDMDIYRHFYSNRVVSLWNSLPADMKDSGSVAALRRK